MLSLETNIQTGVADSIIAGDELYGLKEDRLILDAGKVGFDISESKRLAIFGAFALESREVLTFVSISECEELGEEELGRVMDVGQEGLDALHNLGYPKYCQDLKRERLVDSDASDFALDVLSYPDDSDPGSSIKLASAVEVYGDEMGDVVPVLSYSRMLEDAAYRIRTRLAELSPDNPLLTEKLLRPSKPIRRALAIEAATELLPNDVDNYSNLEL